MSFLFPSFLWGLLAVLIPLAIHLFNFRRTRRIYFTNVSFLKEIETRTSSFRRLKHLLILLARMLAVACLALAFARPYLRGNESEALQRTAITGLYLDNSYSMQNEENNKRYLDIARGHLDDLLKLFRGLSSLQLVTNDFSAQEVSLGTAEGIRDRLTMTELSYTGRSLQAVYDRQKKLAERYSNGKGVQLFWISDFQKSTAGDLARLATDSADFVTLVPVQAEETRNISVDSVWLHTPFIREQQNNILYVSVRNSGNEAVEDLVVRLFLDETQVSTAPASIAPGETARVRFNFTLRGRGFKKGRISFDDYPVTFDNDYFFVLNASPKIRILHVYGDKPPGSYLETVYGNDSLFNIRSFSVNNTDPGQFASADLVIWEGITVPPAAQSEAAREFVGKGGSLLVIPPQNPDITAYASFLGGYGIHGLTAAGGNNRQLVPLNAPDSRTPFFSDVFEESLRTETNVDMPSVVSAWYWGKAGNPLLALRNGHPFLSQTSGGDGKVYLLGAGLYDDAGNFARHALFVPVMYKIAALSVRPGRAAYTFGEREIELPVAEAQPGALYKLRYKGFELIPSQRKVGKQLILELPKGDEVENGKVEAGYYELVADGKTEHVLALNHEKAESRLEYYRPEELRSLFGNRKNVKILDKISGGGLAEAFEKQAAGTSLWRYFLYAALAFLLVEIGLVRFMKS